MGGEGKKGKKGWGEGRRGRGRRGKGDRKSKTVPPPPVPLRPPVPLQSPSNPKGLANPKGRPTHPPTGELGRSQQITGR